MSNLGSIISEALKQRMASPPARLAPFGFTTIMMCLFFGTNFFLFILFFVIKKFAIKPDNALSKREKKELSKPFTGTLDCYTSLTHDLFLTGSIMLLTYVAEYEWFFAHSAKSYSRDLFLFVLIIFFAYAWYTREPIKDLSLLGREQTEEWKGWMQFIFLLYHYFHAEEVYNSVRVMITCYVWMTGFGNFSFFYSKQDFSWLRVVQMLWRLNFAVILLMWTHENTYILYYICPMHTFYFLMVYVTMYCFQSLNVMKWAIRWKLLVLAIIIYIVWDINNGIFDFLFAWLGTDKVIGANSGSVYEYYFRTSLDHWSTFLGMIFALNFPLAEQYFVKVRGVPLMIAGVLMGALTLFWFYFYFPLDKLSYNLTHSYMSIIPLTSYIFFRNITPAIRSSVSMSLHDLGKTTLETYLLQHHIWLSSNAKTLWTLVPGHPWINFGLATLIFFYVARVLSKLTMQLRGMILPEDKNIAWRNMIGTVILFGVLAAVAKVLHAFEPSMLEIIIACEGLCLVCLLLISRFASSLSDQAQYQAYATRYMRLMIVVFVASLLLQLSIGSSPNGSHSALLGLNANNPVANSGKSTYRGNKPECLAAVSKGKWITAPCNSDAFLSTPKTSTLAYCEQHLWAWEAPEHCPLAKISSSKSQSIFKGKSVLFVGDSVVRSVYHEFITLMEPSYNHNRSVNFKHQDQSYTVTTNNCSISFAWAPFAADVAKVMANRGPVKGSKTGMDNFVVAGAALWDALHNHNVSDYREVLKTVAAASKSLPVATATTGNSNQSAVAAPPTTVKVWLLPTIIVDDRLQTADKRQFMTDDKIEAYRRVAQTSPAIQSAFHAVVDPRSASQLRSDSSSDGVHYADEVYKVMTQMLANSYSLHFPQNYVGGKSSKPYKPRPTGSMSSPFYGGCMLALIVILLFSMDSFFGIGWVTLILAGQSFDWDAAYAPYIRKIAALSHNSGGSEGDAKGNGHGHAHGHNHNDEIEGLLASERTSGGETA